MWRNDRLGVSGMLPALYAFVRDLICFCYVLGIKIFVSNITDAECCSAMSYWAAPRSQ